MATTFWTQKNGFQKVVAMVMYYITIYNSFMPFTITLLDFKLLQATKAW